MGLRVPFVLSLIGPFNCCVIALILYLFIFILILFSCYICICIVVLLLYMHPIKAVIKIKKRCTVSFFSTTVFLWFLNNNIIRLCYLNGLLTLQCRYEQPTENIVYNLDVPRQLIADYGFSRNRVVLYLKKSHC